MIVRPAEVEDFSRLELQPHQSGEAVSAPGLPEHWLRCGPVYTAIADNQVIAIIGLIEYPPGNRAEAWALLSRHAGRHMRSLTFEVAAWMACDCPYARVQAAVHAEFKPGIRWARLLGFAQEGVMRKYYDDGSDAILYARVK